MQTPTETTTTNRLGAPPSVALEYLKDILNKDTGKPSGMHEEKTMALRLVLPETDWTQNQLDKAQQFAWGLIQGGKTLAHAAPRFAGTSEAEAYYIGLRAEHARQRIFSFYYVPERQKFFMDSTQDDVITAFANARTPFTPDVEAAIFADFLERYVSSRDSIRPFLNAITTNTPETSAASASGE